MVEAPLFALGLASLLCMQEGVPLVELLATSSADDPASEVLRVFATETPEGEELHVLSRRGRLGTFRFVGDEVVAVLNPHLALPDDLGVNREWVITRDSIGSQGPGPGGALYRQFFPSAAQVERTGGWGIKASADGSTLFFLRGGTEIDDPAEIAAVGLDQEQRFELPMPELPRVQASETGNLVILQTSEQADVRNRDGDLLQPLAPRGTIHLEPRGRWFVRETREGVDLERLLVPGAPAIQLPVPPPLIAVVFEADHMLVVGRTRAELFRLGDGDPEGVARIEATPDHRFSSAALHPRESGGPPWIALGELAVLVPQLLLPDVPAPRANVVARVADESTIVATWESEVDGWRAATPLVQWSGEARLLVSTKTRALASQRRYQ